MMQPLMWTDLIKPTPEEMHWCLRQYVGGDYWRVPKRKWHELYIFSRGHFGNLKQWQNFKSWKRQRGIIVATAVYGMGVIPELSNVTHTNSQVAPTQARIALAYDSDGRLRFDGDATITSSTVYEDLTTQSDDTNNHTSEWWPDSPSVNEGLNWDIRYINAVFVGTNGGDQRFSTAGVDRTSGTWYLLDTVSNDHGDGLQDGAIIGWRANGGPKDPQPGTSTFDVDIEIRVTGSGSALANHHADFTMIGTSS